MKTNKIFFLLLFAFLYSCQNTRNTELVIEETIALPKEDYVVNGGLTMKYVEDNKTPYLYYRTPNIKTYNNELLIYNLNSKKLEKKYVYSKENNFHKSFSSFIYINKDSILLTSSNDSLYVSNSKQEIVDKINFEFVDTNNQLSQLTNYLYTPIDYHKNNLYFSPSLYLEEEKKYYVKRKFIYKFDLKTKKVEPFKTIFPEDFVSSDYFSPHYYSCFDGENLVLSPHSSHDLWVVNINNGNLKKIETKSEFFNEFKKYTENVKPLTTQEYQFVSSYYSRYSCVAYDKYRKVYYRFFYPGHNVEKTSNKLVELNRNPEKVSIIILDKNFKKIGETLFENKNLSNTYFISPKGLFVRLIPKRELLDNSNLKFVKINIKYEEN